MPATPPTVRRKRLARVMRELRLNAKKTREEVAEYVGISPVTVTRLEKAEHNPKPGDIAMMCRFYGLNERQTEDLVQLARECKTKGWWQHHSGLSGSYLTYIGLEEEVRALRQYSVDVVPGLLQTEAYQRALLAAELTASTDAVVEEKIAARRKRKERLRGDNALHAWFVINEDCLRRQVGGAKVMREQLHHLIEESRQDNIEVQVLPFAAGAHPAIATGSFTIMSFPHPLDPDVVYVEMVTTLFMEQAAEIEAHARLFDQLRARALGPDESRDLIVRAAAEL
ncbi:helix-turn-helix domain-containing protein [Spirillospora sp. CA-253888]